MIAIYLVGFGLYAFVHLLCGNWGKMATMRRHGRVLFRFPSILAVAVMSICWPVVVPMQIWQGVKS